MFGCEEVEKVVWNIIMSSLFEDLTCPTTWTRKGKWLGIFPNEEDPNPLCGLCNYIRLLAMMLKHGERIRNL